jgi:hypothetical protein
MTIEEPEIIGNFEGYECMSCRRTLHAFVSHRITGPIEVKSTAIQTSPCRYCSETQRMKGMKKLLGYLIEEREDR